MAPNKYPVSKVSELAKKFRSGKVHAIPSKLKPELALLKARTKYIKISRGKLNDKGKEVEFQTKPEKPVTEALNGSALPHVNRNPSRIQSGAVAKFKLQILKKQTANAVKIAADNLANLKVPKPEPCKTISGAAPDKPCIFPFKHDGKTYTKC